MKNAHGYFKEDRHIQKRTAGSGEKDAKSFEPLSEHISMPKDKQAGTNKYKEETLQKCLKKRVKHLWKPLKLSYEGILLHEELTRHLYENNSKRCGRWYTVFEAAINSAYLNVLINLTSITDEEYVKNNWQFTKNFSGRQ